MDASGLAGESLQTSSSLPAGGFIEPAVDFKGNTTRTTATIQFDSSLPPGARVWLSAYWYGTRAQNGLASAPVDTYIQYGISFPGQSLAA